MTNPFDAPAAAQRYRRARPNPHPSVLAELCRLSGRTHFPRALDVACGCGSSSLALADISDHVEAFDSSPAMLAEAPSHPRIHYSRQFAESTDLPSASFDLVLVGAALHWFNQPLFYAETRRLLAPGGLLAIYNDHFTAHAADDPLFARWYRSVYLKRAPRRGPRLTDFALEPAAAAGFRLLADASAERHEPMTRQAFIDFLLTQSNALTAIASARESDASLAAFLEDQLSAWPSRPTAQKAVPYDIAPSDAAPLAPEPTTPAHTQSAPADLARPMIFKWRLWLLSVD